MSVSFFVAGSRLSSFQWFRPVPGCVSPAVWGRFCRAWCAGSVGLVCPGCGARLRVLSGASVFVSSFAAPVAFVPAARAVWSGCCPGCGVLFLPPS